MNNKQHKSIPLLLLLIFISNYSLAKSNDPHLQVLIEQGLKNNSGIKALTSQHIASQQVASQVGAWPDPTIGGNYFLKPIETRLGAQQANISVNQAIPWVPRLSAMERQAKLRSKSLDSKTQVLKLNTVLKIKQLYYQAYVLKKQIEIDDAQSIFLDQLSKVVLAKVKVGKAGQQDVIQTTLEISRLEEDKKLSLQKLYGVTAAINEILNRSPDTPVKVINELKVGGLPQTGWQKLWQRAEKNHPSLLAARYKMDAAAAAITAAKLKRVPDIKASISWFKIEERETAMVKTEGNEDAWAVGAAFTIPLWSKKYTAYNQQATSLHEASVSDLASANNHHKRAIAESWQDALTSQDLLSLYDTTIIPQAEQVLQANQRTYRQAGVNYDRVISDFRKLLNFKIRRHKELGRLATLIGKLENYLGEKLTSNSD